MHDDKIKGARPLRSLAAIVTTLGISACAAGPNDTVALVRSGDGRACATPDVKRQLRAELTSFLRYSKLKSSLDGKDTRTLGLVLDPIVAVSAQHGAVECAASAYLSFDGKEPFDADNFNVGYSVLLNVANSKEYTLRGNFSDVAENVRLLYETLGLLER